LILLGTQLASDSSSCGQATSLYSTSLVEECDAVSIKER
jgi:hypothetical protein